MYLAFLIHFSSLPRGNWLKIPEYIIDFQNIIICFVPLLSFLHQHEKESDRLGYDAVSLCNSFPIFRDKVVVSSSRVEMSSIFTHLAA